MNFESLDYSLHGTVALIRLSTPFNSANTLGMASLRELREAAASASEDQAVRLLMIVGKGRSFSAGADLVEMAACEGRSVLAFLREGQSVLRQIMDLEVITLAAVNGVALGGGLELALACDIRWAHTSAVFGLPEAKLGLLPGWGAMSLLSRAAPASLAVEMLVSGENCSAHRAYEAGLVSRLFQERDFDAAALAVARKFADKPAGTFREIKTLLRRQRGKVDFSAGNRAFLRLWNGRGARWSTLVTNPGGDNGRP
jgi:enoyl-CoA hydratase/carnithine racemase